MTVTALALVALLAGLQEPAGSDAGVLVVRLDTVEVARETFRLAPGPAPGTWSVAAAVRYDRARPIIALRPILELGPDSAPRALQYEVADGRGTRRILAQPGPARVTVREIAPGVERAREYSATGRTVLLDDSVFVLYAVAARHAGTEPVALTAVYPRQQRREIVRVHDLGLQATTVNRDPARLGLVELRGPRGTVRVWRDAAGRVLKVEAQGLVAERQPDD